MIRMDALLARQTYRSKENTLQLQTAQTRRAIGPEPLQDPVSSVTAVVIVAGRLGGDEEVHYCPRVSSKQFRRQMIDPP